MIEIFALLGLYILIVIATFSRGDGAPALLTIGAFIGAAYKIIPGVVKLINLRGQIRAYEFSTSDLVQTGSGKVKVDPALNSLQSVELRKVHFEYRENPILKDFDLLLKKGDFLGITGKSGNGKTTLLNLILGFLYPAKGEVLINDKVVDKEEIKSYWPMIAYVRQQSFLIHDSVQRNIILEENPSDLRRLNTALMISGLDEFVAQSQEGLGRQITENGKNISGGQQQRIAIARAIYKDAGLILLDEPFNQLDKESELTLLRYFQDLAQQGRIVVLVTHDKHSLSFCNKIISL